MRRFFDTNILVYSQDRSEPSKRALAQALVAEAMDEEGFVVSTQVLIEFYSTVLRRKLLVPSAALVFVWLWSEHDIVPQTPELLLHGLELHQAHSISMWDALIVQAGIEARCDILLTEDLQHGRRFGELEVVNPFRPAAAHERPARGYGPVRTATPRKVRKRRR
jgi:predicted nucleic acid-binding protein